MVICATLTSLRRFFRHIAPKLIGERSSGSNSASQRTPGLVTIGGSNMKYSKFPGSHGHNDESYGMENMITSRVDEHVPRGEGRGSGDDNSGDGSSQKGILQTHTTTVMYEPRQIPK